MLAEMLLAAGHRVGLYTSPHLVSFRERVMVDRVPVSEEAVTLWASRLEEPALRHGATFFEVSTALAFADFAARGVEIAVVEVGLGGRLDATNVLSPLASGVTRIAVEHTEYLGPDRSGIAREKAGIAKPGVPFVTTEADEAIAAVLLAEARRRGAVAERLDPAACLSGVEAGPGGVRFDAVTPQRRYRGLELGLAGAYQAENALLALRLAELVAPSWPVGEAAIRDGLRRARVPGRFDRRGRWIYDVAHNPDGARALVAALRAAAPPRPLVAVVAVLRDKAWREMLEVLGPAVDRLVLTRAPSAPAERAWDLEEVAAWARQRGLEASAVPELGQALEQRAASGGDRARHRLLPHRRRRAESLARRSAARVDSRMPVSALPGFRDLFPDALARRRRIFGVWRDVAARYGFEEYDGPPLEPVELYTQKSGDEIVDQLYRFTDKGGRDVALRPEMTPTLARMVAQRAAQLKKPIRWFSIPQLFRYERQQRGRLREHFQLNMDIIGEAGPLADAEVIGAAVDILRALGFGPGDVRVRVSDRRILADALVERRRPGGRGRSPGALSAIDKLERNPEAIATGSISGAARRSVSHRR